MSYENILYETGDGVATITINRPETMNSLSRAAGDELISAFKSAARDRETRAVILTGAGKGFSSGAYLNELVEDPDADITDYLRTGLHVLIASIRGMEKPVICALNGAAAGAGSSLALAADYRIASENATFVFGAFINIGLVPDGGLTYLLQQIVGAGKTLELALLADNRNRVDAQQALDMGIVNRVVPHDDLMDEAQLLAGKLAKMPTRAIGLAKRAIYRASDRSFADSIDYEAQMQGIAFKSHDFREGVASFLEKREPQFKGE